MLPGRVSPHRQPPAISPYLLPPWGVLHVTATGVPHTNPWRGELCPAPALRLQWLMTRDLVNVAMSSGWAQGQRCPWPGESHSTAWGPGGGSFPRGRDSKGSTGALRSGCFKDNVEAGSCVWTKSSEVTARENWGREREAACRRGRAESPGCAEGVPPEDKGSGQNRGQAAKGLQGPAEGSRPRPLCCPWSWGGWSCVGKQHQFSSGAQSCLTLCNPMNHSSPGLPVHHQLPEFTHYTKTYILSCYHFNISVWMDSIFR